VGRIKINKITIEIFDDCSDLMVGTELVFRGANAAECADWLAGMAGKTTVSQNHGGEVVIPASSSSMA